MLNTIYHLVTPRRFEVGFENITLDSQKVLVRPTYLSICNADQRYYQGLRPPHIMKEKLPMALIHEGIGEVLYDPQGIYQSKEKVVMIPNEMTESDDIIAGNYLRSSKFRASSIDGFLQESILLDHSRIVRLPENINLNVASFTEFVSVSMHAITRMNNKAHERRNYIGVWGDGNLGYVTALLLRYLMPSTKIIVVGVDYSKLEKFTFADKVIISDDIPKDIKIDHAFECVGGNHSQTAIDQIIDHINPEGSVALLGVSEYAIPLNTRMILEKGLTVYGNSRSERGDFVRTIDNYVKYPDIVEYLSNIINQEIEINTIGDISYAFESDIRKEYGKTIMKWNM